MKLNILIMGILFSILSCGCGGGTTGVETPGAGTAPPAELPFSLSMSPDNGQFITEAQTLLLHSSRNAVIQLSINGGPWIDAGNVASSYLEEPIEDNGLKYTVTGISGQTVEVGFRARDYAGNVSPSQKHVYSVSQATSQDPVEQSPVVQSRFVGLKTGTILGEPLTVQGEFHAQ